MKAILKKYGAEKLPLWNSELYYIHSLKENTKIMQDRSPVRYLLDGAVSAENVSYAAFRYGTYSAGSKKRFGSFMISK